MKLCRFTHNGATRIGKISGGSVSDLSGVAGVTASMRDLLTHLPALCPALEAAP